MSPIDSAALANLTVVDPRGNDVALASLWADQPIALALIRHFG